jgi:hypothetical protein
MHAKAHQSKGALQHIISPSGWRSWQALVRCQRTLQVHRGVPVIFPNGQAERGMLPEVDHDTGFHWGCIHKGDRKLPAASMVNLR